MKIHIGEEAKARLMETLRADVSFLTNLHLMDYSLLLGNCRVFLQHFYKRYILMTDISKYLSYDQSHIKYYIELESHIGTGEINFLKIRLTPCLFNLPLLLILRRRN